MRSKTITTILVILIVTLASSTLWGGTLEGKLKLGGVILEEEGDLSTVQETYNIHDGFSVTQIWLQGTLDPLHYFTLNLREVNLDSRKGDLVYRMPGTLKFTASYDQHRQVFDPQRNVNSERKDWRFGAGYTPVEWLRVSGYFNHLARDGDRLSFPSGTVSQLGSRYDYSLITGRLAAELRKGGRGGAISYRVSDFKDELNGTADRTGQVVSARLFVPCYFYDKWTHLVRGAYGVRKLSNRDIDYTLSNFQYTGVFRPFSEFQFKYNFDANRIDNESTQLVTDRFHNNFDATYYHKFGRLYGGYGYEMNDDDRALTDYHSWRVGAALRYEKYATVKLHYAGRVKRDQEELTLLKDVEAVRFRGDLEIRPVEGLVVGGGFAEREREYPDIGVEAEGQSVNGHARYSYPNWGVASVDYTYSKDEYTDLAGKFDANSHIVTSRIDFERITDVRLSSGVTYVDAGQDLDIEKSMLFFEGMYTVMDDYHLELRYNIYNYDDFVLLDRYYTANVVWINVAYDLHLK